MDNKIKTLPIEQIKSFYSQEKLDKDLDRKYIEKIKLSSKSIAPIIISKDNHIIDGHHRYIAFKECNGKEIPVIKLNVSFEESSVLRDFQKHLKGMTPKDWTLWNTHEEFKEILTWLNRHMIK